MGDIIFSLNTVHGEDCVMSKLLRLSAAKPVLVALSLVLVAIVPLVAFSAAIARTWKSTDGSYKLKADFVDAKDGKVSLRRTDGKVIKVPISALCEEDQAYVAERTAQQGAPSASGAAAERPAQQGAPADVAAEPSAVSKRRTYAQLSQAANSLRTATEAMRLFKVFLADASIAQAEREKAEQHLPLWKERADKHMVRVGPNWLTLDDAANKRLQAKQLVDDAVRLIKLGKYDEAIDKCGKASNRDKSGIRADFMLGLLYALARRDAELAHQRFAQCVSRDPQHIAALNNLALTEVRLRKYPQALTHWQSALEIAPSSPEILQNLGRLFDLANQRRVTLLPGVQRRFGELYATAGVSAGQKEFNRRTGWLYLDYYPPVAEQSNRTAGTDRPEPDAKTQMITIASGSGFVVHPEYVLTNRHVAKAGSALLVVPPGEEARGLAASIVGVSDGPDDDVGSDLAVVYCKGLTAPPLRFIKTDYVPRGTEIMVLGYPGMVGGKTPSLKSIHGTVAGLPDNSFNAYTIDALTNPGNSGGPICDAVGSVLGIHHGRTLLGEGKMDYELGIPHFRALSLLKKCIPGYRQLPPNAEAKQWTEVDGLASRSTVLIWIQDARQNTPMTPPATSEHATTGQQLEDRWCVNCYGSCKVKCGNCQNGTVTMTRTVTKEMPGGAGLKHTYQEKYRVECKICKGTGGVPCSYCNHGIDKSLR
jgi:S1-C subfamily serine protease